MNLHKAYYKDYFNGIVNWDNIKDSRNTNAVRQHNAKLTHERLKIPDDNDLGQDVKKINLKIQYPGFVTGIGINHEAGIEGEFKLGLHFDWTWGMPVVYGSSVKGVLRSWFMEIYDQEKYGIDAGDLLMDIFEGATTRDIDSERKKYKDGWAEKTKKPENRIYMKNKSIYNRDIFFDAVLTSADSKGRILCSDSITPHPEPLQNPIPLTFLKIAPGCTLEFRFKLVDSVIDGKTLSADDKREIFKEILTTVGVGAKTNVGYGQLKEVK